MTTYYVIRREHTEIYGCGSGSGISPQLYATVASAKGAQTRLNEYFNMWIERAAEPGSRQWEHDEAQKQLSLGAWKIFPVELVLGTSI